MPDHNDTACADVTRERFTCSSRAANGSLLAALASLSLLMAACGGNGAAPDDQEVPDAPVAATANPDQASAAHDHAAAAGEGELLLAIMQRLNADMAGLSQGLWLEDWQVIAARSASIAGHAPIAPEEIERIQATLGDEMHAFEEADEAVHTAAVRMHEAAEARDMKQFLAAFTEVQQGCVSCHTSFRDRLRK